MLGILQIAKGSPCQHRVYDPGRQDRPNTGEGKCHLYFLSAETETLRERVSSRSDAASVRAAWVESPLPESWDNT